MTESRQLHPGPRQQVPAWFLFAVLALVAVTAIGFLYLGTRLAPGSNLPVRELRILSRAYDRIDENYLFEFRTRSKAAVGKLFSELGPRYQERPGGYIRILKCGYRAGDKAPMAYVELVDRPQPDTFEDDED